MSTTAAQLQFACEFVTFLVAAAGLALVLLNADLITDTWWTKLALFLGFVALGVGAFGHGSLIVRNDDAILVERLRAIAIALLAIGTVRWRAGRIARLSVWLGLALLAGSAAAEASNASDTASGLLAAGSVAVGAALLAASRRSIAARVAASAAGTIMLVVLVLSVALSAVLSSSAQTEQLNRLDARARTEARLARNSFVQEIQTARYVGEYLEKSAAATLISLGAASSPAAGDQGTIAGLLTPLQALYPVGGLAYLLPGGGVAAASGVASSLGSEITGLDLVRQTSCPGPVDRGSALVMGREVFAAAAYPECFGSRRLGVVVRISPLGGAYLGQRHQDDSAVSLALVDRAGGRSAAGPQPAGGDLANLAGAVIASGSPRTRVTPDWFTAAVPIQASDGSTIAALVASAPTSSALATRDRLFRTLFVIALGGTLLALGLASVVGDRITARLRRLTNAAEGIRRGDIARRADISSADEVGVLGGAFDSMVTSIQEKTDALQTAAADEARLRNRLEAVVAGMGDALVAVDGRGVVTDFNRAAEDLTGITADAARGRPADEVLDLVAEDGTSLGSRLRTPSPVRWGLPATLQRAGGAPIPVAISAGAWRGPGHDVVGSVLVLRDLSREREVERMKTEFLSRVGHELRTPLTGIMGYADILLRHDVEPLRARMWSGEILVEAKRLLRIVEMVEFFASSGAGRVLLRRDRIEVRPLVDGIVADWTGRIPSHHTITGRVAPNTPDLLGDRRWLGLALDELVDNAVKFSPGGGPITVSGGGLAHVGEDHVGAVEISVADRGKGMTPDEQANAFGDFVQGDASDTRQFGGLGLGLTLVQRVVEGHGGKVSCVSTPGQGSVFTMTVPAVPADAASGPKPRRTRGPVRMRH